MNKADNYEIDNEQLHKILLDDFMSAYNYGLPQHFAARAEIARLRDIILELEEKLSVKPAKGSTAKAGKSESVAGE